MKKIKKFLASLSIGLAVPVFAFAAVSAATVEVVTGDTSSGENQPGWLFNRDTTTDTPYEFNNDAFSIGSGSLYVAPIGANPSDKFIGENFINAPIADINNISYDFKIGAGGTASDANEFYMNVYANFGVSNDLKFFDCRYNVVPTVGSTAGFTLVTFDPSLTYPVTTSSTSPVKPCPSSPAAMGADATIRVFSLNVGDTTASDEGLDGYLDNVVVNTTDNETIYDFEPAITVSDKERCKKGGWMISNTPVFKNQGDCVSSFASEDKANPVVGFLRGLF